MLTVRRLSIIALTAALVAVLAAVAIARPHPQRPQHVVTALRASDVDWTAWKGYKRPYVTAEPTPKPIPKQVVADDSPDFWRRLANCESPNGASGHFIGYFQFSPDTARSVGINGSESYEEQRAAAQRWAAGVNPGSTAGWPHCWWVALR